MQPLQQSQQKVCNQNTQKAPVKVLDLSSISQLFDFLFYFIFCLTIDMFSSVAAGGVMHMHVGVSP